MGAAPEEPGRRSLKELGTQTSQEEVPAGGGYGKETSSVSGGKNPQTGLGFCKRDEKLLLGGSSMLGDATRQEFRSATEVNAIFTPFRGETQPT